MASSIDEFFDDDDFGEAELAEPAAIIHSLFKEAGSTVEAAAQRLLVSYRAHRAPSFSTIVAQIIVPLAEARLESHQYLVQLLEQLKTLLAAGCAELRPGDDISLSYELWERALRYGAPDPDDDLRDVYRQDWINTNLFAALVHEAAIEDLSSFAEHTLNLSLRRSGWRVAWKLSAGESSPTCACSRFAHHRRTHARCFVFRIDGKFHRLLT